MAKVRTCILIPAGVREIEERKEWIALPEAVEAKQCGISFGFELKGNIPQTFSVQCLNGLPYLVHAPASMLERWYRAEKARDIATVSAILTQIAQWARLNPKPEFVVFHGARMEKDIPVLDANRFQCQTDPKEWLAMANWHIGTLQKIKEIGIMPALETLALHNFAWDGVDWLAMTYHESRVGILHDLWKIAQAAGVATVIDFEHLYFTVLALNRNDIETRDIPNSGFADPDKCPEFPGFFGFAAEQGKACWAPKPASWQDIIAMAKPNVCHIGGLHPPVIETTPEETRGPLLQAHLHDVCSRHRNPNVQRFLATHRGGSHGPVEPTDQLLISMLCHALQHRHGNPLYLTLEVANQGEGKSSEDPNRGFWWWSSPTAMLDSFRTLCSMMPGIMVTTPR